ncbi:MAG TPA: hypothetical protein VHI53_14240 [Gaiellaceae bacterium]|jgi:hypothetical protein|nr:hypothetical protein [Gaiellaceae bacterium]
MSADDLNAAFKVAVELDDERDDGDRRRLRTTLATANGNRRVLSTLDLALSLRRSPEWTEAPLAESERDGVVEQVGRGRGRLTARAERRIGPALRALAIGQDDV